MHCVDTWMCVVLYSGSLIICCSLARVQKVGNDALYRYIVTGYYWCGKAIMNRTFYVEAGVTRGGRYKIKNVGKQRVV